MKNFIRPFENEYQTGLQLDGINRSFLCDSSGMPKDVSLDVTPDGPEAKVFILLKSIADNINCKIYTDEELNEIEKILREITDGSFFKPRKIDPEFIKNWFLGSYISEYIKDINST